jgi:hypothetical protein
MHSDAAIGDRVTPVDELLRSLFTEIGHGVRQGLLFARLNGGRSSWFGAGGAGRLLVGTEGGETPLGRWVGKRPEIFRR